MKDFFDHYGKAVITTLVITALIAVCSIIRPVITDALDDMTGKLNNYVSDRFSNIGVEGVGKEEQPAPTRPTFTMYFYREIGKGTSQPLIPVGQPIGQPAGQPIAPPIDCLPSIVYFFEEGMTWEEWLESEYNTGLPMPLSVRLSDDVLRNGEEGAIALIQHDLGGTISLQHYYDVIEEADYDYPIPCPIPDEPKPPTYQDLN